MIVYEFLVFFEFFMEGSDFNQAFLRSFCMGIDDYYGN